MIRTTFAATAALFFAFPAFAHDGVHVNDAFAIVVGASAPTAAVYFVVENHAIADDRLVAASTVAAEKAVLHQSIESAGVMTMDPVDEGFVIAGSGQFALERGAAHVMLLGLKQPLAAGDTITLTLTFERAGEVVVEVPVNPAAAMGDDHFTHAKPGP